MITEAELRVAVDAAFAVTARDLSPWPDPHPDWSPLDEEYSRLSDAAKWRIVGARAEAWVAALVDAGLASVERDADVEWSTEPPTCVMRASRLVPLTGGALPLVIASSRLGDLDDAGTTLGAGDPAVCVAFIPDCGCDACDSGSQDVVDELDVYVESVVTGKFRRLSSGDREITVRGEHGWSASGSFRRGEVAEVIADPSGWDEVSGSSWLSATRPA